MNGKFDIMITVIKVLIPIAKIILPKALRPKDGVKKYIFYSNFRRTFNKIYFENVDIEYTFIDSPNNDNAVGMEAAYSFKDAVIEGTDVNGMELYLNMKEYNSQNIKMSATVNGKNVTPTIKTNGSKDYGDDGAYWEIPFYDENGEPIRYRDKVDVTLTIKWKNFCPKGNLDRIIIDPRNYAAKNFVKNIKITINNAADKFAIKTIKKCIYSRRTMRLLGNTGGVEIYNSANNKDGSSVLVNKHPIKENVISDKKLFVLKFTRENPDEISTDGQETEKSFV